MLVGANEKLPADPLERYREDGDILGCNRILCKACGAWVRNVAGLKIDIASMSRTAHEAFYEQIASGPREWPFLTKNIGGEMYRVYACRCNWHQTPSIKWINSSECDGWRCAGHPAP